MYNTLPNIIDKETVERLHALIGRAGKIVITCHVSPDGDAIGSSIGLCQVLKAMGKQATVITPDTPPRQLQFFPNVKSIVVASCHPHTARRLTAEADLIFCLDFNDLRRVDKFADALTAATADVVLIDHHLDPTVKATVTISHPEISSTSALVYRVLHDLSLTDFLSPTGATAIYTGMMTDTGNFSYNSLDPSLYLIVADLVSRGVDKDAVYREVFNTSSLSRVRIQGYAASRKLELFPDAGTALITLSRRELDEFEYEKGDTETLVNLPLSIPGIVCSVFMRQDEDDYVKISTRSKGDFPVNKVCERYFGGGGHLNAAGGEWNGTLDEAVARFLELVKGGYFPWGDKE